MSGDHEPDVPGEDPGEGALGVLLARCSACWCLVSPSDVAAHERWHALDSAVDIGAAAHIENLIERVFRLEGNPQDAPDGPSVADCFVKALEVYDPEGVAIWIQSPNRLLDGKTPVAVLKAGDTRRVWRVLDAMCAGNTT